MCLRSTFLEIYAQWTQPETFARSTQRLQGLGMDVYSLPARVPGTSCVDTLIRRTHQHFFQ